MALLCQWSLCSCKGVSVCLKWTCSSARTSNSGSFTCVLSLARAERSCRRIDLLTDLIYCDISWFLQKKEFRNISLLLQESEYVSHPEPLARPDRLKLFICFCRRASTCLTTWTTGSICLIFRNTSFFMQESDHLSNNLNHWLDLIFRNTSLFIRESDLLSNNLGCWINLIFWNSSLFMQKSNCLSNNLRLWIDQIL